MGLGFYSLNIFPVFSFLCLMHPFLKYIPVTIHSLSSRITNRLKVVQSYFLIICLKVPLNINLTSTSGLAILAGPIAIGLTGSGSNGQKRAIFNSIFVLIHEGILPFCRVFRKLLRKLMGCWLLILVRLLVSLLLLDSLLHVAGFSTITDFPPDPGVMLLSLLSLLLLSSLMLMVSLL